MAKEADTRRRLHRLRLGRMTRVQTINVRRGHRRAAPDYKLKSKQRAIALSYAEAETYGMVACSAGLVGIQSFASDLGMQLSAAVYAMPAPHWASCRDGVYGKYDTTAPGVSGFKKPMLRNGLRSNRLTVSRDPSNLFTKHVSEVLVGRQMKLIGTDEESGRVETAPERSLLGIPKSYLFRL